MADALKNFAKSTVVTPPSPAGSGLTLTVQTGEGARFPAPPFNAVVFPSDAEPDVANATIIRVTTIVGDVFTFQRTQESSNNRAIQLGDRIRQTTTAKTFTDIYASIDVLSLAAASIANQLSIETAARIAKDDSLSNSASIMNAAIAVVETHASTASTVAAAADVHANTASAAATSVDARLTSVSALLALSIQTASAAATAADTHANTASAAATSVDSRIASLSIVFASLSARSVGAISTHGLQSILNALSNRISVGGGAASVTSNKVSAGDASVAAQVRLDSTAASIAALSQALSYVNAASVRSAGNISTKGLQSVLNALSNVASVNKSALANASTVGSVAALSLAIINDASISVVIKADIASVSAILATSVQTASAAATSVLNIINNISAVSGATSVKGIQSVVNQLSNRISGILAGGGISVTSVELLNARSAVQNASLVGSIAALSLAILNDASVSAVIKADIASVSAAIKTDIASVSAVLAGSINTASLAATSVDSRVGSLSVVFASLSVRSVGNISTHGFQSILNALSNVDSANRSALQAASTVGSIAALSLAYVNDASVSVVIKADIASVSAVLAGSINTASLAATSVDSRVASLSIVFASLSARSVGNISTHGFQSIFNALSNRISTIAAGAGSVTSTELSDAKSAVANASTAGSLAAISIFQAVSARSVGNVSTKGLQSVINALSNTESANRSALAGASTVGSIAALSLAILNDASVSVVIKADIASVSAVLAGSINTASLAATSVDSRVASLSIVFASLSARSVGNISTHGFQSIFNALSNRISTIAAGAGSVTSTELSDARSAVANASTAASIAAISLFQAISARSVGNVSTKGLQSVINALSNTVSVNRSAWTNASTVGSIAALSLAYTNDASVSAVIKADIASVSAVLATSINTASAAATSVDARVASLSVVFASLSVRSVGAVSTHGLQSIFNALSNRISANASAFAGASTAGSLAALSIVQAVSARSIGNVSTKGLQSVVNALSAQIVAVSAAAALALSNIVSASQDSYSAVINASTAGSMAALSQALSYVNAASVRSVGNISTKGLQSVLNALSNRISAAGGGAGSVTSTELSTVRSALAFASTAGSIAAISLFQNVSVRSVGNVSTKGLQSVFDAISNQLSAAISAGANTASQIVNASTAGSIAAISVLQVFLSGISSRSVGNVSTHGLQSVINAISNRISGIAAGAGSVTSTELSDAKSAVVNASTAGSLAAISLYQAVSARSVGNVSTKGLQSVINALSNVTSANRSANANASTVGSIAALSLAILNDASVSAVIKADIGSVSAVLATSINTASLAATSVDSRVASLSVVFASLSARSAGNISTHGFQSIFNALSNRISAAGGGAGSVTSTELSDARSAVANASTAGSIAAISIFQNVSVRSVGNVSTKGLQSVINAISNTASVNRSAWVNASTVGSIAALSLAILNDASVSVVIKADIASVSAILATSINTASLAATSVDSRVASLSVFFASLSARSVGNISTHGLQSILNALSNRISGVAGGTGSVTSNELSIAAAAASAQAASALSDAISAGQATASQIVNASTAGSLAAISLIQFASIGRINLQNADTVSLIPGQIVRLAGSANAILRFSTTGGYLPYGAALATTAVSAQVDVQTRGNFSLTSLQMKSVFGVSAFTGIGNMVYPTADGFLTVTPTGAQGLFPLGQVQAARIFNIDPMQVQDLTYGANNLISARKPGNVSVKGLQSILDALSDRISVNTSAFANASTAGSMAAISIFQKASVRNSSNVSVAGLQSVLNALSVKIAAGGAAGSVTSTKVNIASADIVNLQNVDTVSLIPGQIVRMAGSANAVLRFSALGIYFPYGAALATAAVSAQVDIQRQGNVSLTSLQMKSVFGASAFTGIGSMVYPVADGFLTVVATGGAGLYPLGQIQAARQFNIKTLPMQDLAYGANNLMSARKIGDVSVKGLQSVMNALSDRISAATSALVNASTPGSLAAISLLSIQANTISLQVASISAQLGTPQLNKIQTGNQTITGTGFTNISGLAVSVGANQTYQVDGRVVFTLSVLTGTEFGFIYPGANQVSVGHMRMEAFMSVLMASSPAAATLFTSTFYQLGIVIPANMSTVATVQLSILGGASGTQYMIDIAGIVNCTSAGTVQMQAKQSAAGGGVQLMQGSYLRAFRIV